MQQKPDNFSMEDAMRFVSSPAGRQLMAMLQKSNGDAVKKAMDQAAKGNMEEAKDAIAGMTLTEDMKDLLRSQGGFHG